MTAYHGSNQESILLFLFINSLLITKCYSNQSSRTIALLSIFEFHITSKFYLFEINTFYNRLIYHLPKIYFCKLTNNPGQIDETYINNVNQMFIVFVFTIRGTTQHNQSNLVEEIKGIIDYNVLRYGSILLVFYIVMLFLLKLYIIFLLSYNCKYAHFLNTK